MCVFCELGLIRVGVMGLVCVFCESGVTRFGVKGLVWVHGEFGVIEAITYRMYCVFGPPKPKYDDSTALFAHWGAAARPKDVVATILFSASSHTHTSCSASSSTPSTSSLLAVHLACKSAMVSETLRFSKHANQHWYFAFCAARTYKSALVYAL